MTDKIASEESKNVQILLRDYENQKREIEKMDFRNLTEKENEVLAKYSDTKDFFVEIRNALDFTKSSTLVSLNDDVEKGTSSVCHTLMKDKEEYVETMVTLSGGFNKDLLKAVEGTRTGKIEPEMMGIAEYNATVKSALNNKNLSDYANAFIAEKKGDDGEINISVSDLMQSIDKTKEYREQYKIQDENVIGETLRVFIKERDEGRANVIFDEPSVLYNEVWREMQAQLQEQEQQEKTLVSIDKAKELYEEGYRSENEKLLVKNEGLSPVEAVAVCVVLKKFEEYGVNEKASELAKEELEDKLPDVEIVESSDGFVMNTSPVNSTNEKTFNEKVERGNEVIHNEVPQETTVDVSMAKGKVKLEEANDLGTKEVTKIEAGAELGHLNEKYDTEQIDDNKKTNKNVDFER